MRFVVLCILLSVGCDGGSDEASSAHARAIAAGSVSIGARTGVRVTRASCIFGANCIVARPRAVALSYPLAVRRAVSSEPGDGRSLRANR
jgi:hypothetical protein